MIYIYYISVRRIKMKKRFKSIGASVLSFAMICSLIPGDVTKAAAAGNYSYIQDYTLGWSGGKIAVYEGGTEHKTVDQAGLKKYNIYGEADNPFEAQTEQAWDTPDLKLSQPVQFTSSDGVVHDVENMLTGFDFIADPTAIDNSEVDGKLYVYGTTEGFSYGDMSRDNYAITAKPGDELKENGYRNHSLSILSTSDMVNWTDEGFMDSFNLTNLPSYEEDNFVKSGITGHASWAPSGMKKKMGEDGRYKYYLFYTNGGNSGYVMSDSPTGPWEDPEGRAIFDKQLPNCSDMANCFDPAVLMDDDGSGYVYFGGLSTTSGRAVKVKFDPDTGRVIIDGDPVKLPTHAMFEDNEINKFNGKYYYSYCTVHGSQTLTKNASIAVYVSSDPLNVSFTPDSNASEAFKPFTDSNGTYRHFLGTVLENTATIFGEFYNNHHHMQEYKGHTYIFYHSTVLHNTLHRVSKRYRNLHVDEITVDPETDAIEGFATDEKGNKTVATYEGPEQVEKFNPYRDFAGKEKYINATTTSYSAGIKSTRDDEMVLDSKNGSPMVVDEIDTGDWTKIQGVDFGNNGAVKVAAEIKSATNNGAIEVFIDDPTKAGNMVASIPVTSNEQYTDASADIASPVTGVHDVYFVFRGNDYTVASWKFTEKASEIQNDPSPSPSFSPAPTNNPVTTTPPEPPKTEIPSTVKAGAVEYAVNASAQTVKVSKTDKKAKSVVIPATVDVAGKPYAVTEIAAKAFAGSKKLKSVTIGKNIKSIGAKAFYKCPALKKVTVKSTVLKKVGKASLKGINAKATIKVPKKKLKAYKKLFKGKGQGKRARIK